jgi:hypothetical protein
MDSEILLRLSGGDIIENGNVSFLFYSSKSDQCYSKLLMNTQIQSPQFRPSPDVKEPNELSCRIGWKSGGLWRFCVGFSEPA